MPMHVIRLRFCASKLRLMMRCWRAISTSSWPFVRTSCEITRLRRLCWPSCAVILSRYTLTKFVLCWRCITASARIMLRLVHISTRSHTRPLQWRTRSATICEWVISSLSRLTKRLMARRMISLTIKPTSYSRHSRLQVSMPITLPITNRTYTMREESLRRRTRVLSRCATARITRRLFLTTSSKSSLHVATISMWLRMATSC